jgi:hypothetical protein
MGTMLGLETWMVRISSASEGWDVELEGCEVN